MLSIIKSAIPSPIKKTLHTVKQKTYDQWYKKRLFKKMQVKHAELIEQVKGKQKIKVVFLAIHESIWKVDPVFRKMLEDPFFEPEILVCPYTVYGEERMLEDMQQAYNYFISKGYPVRKAREENGSWVKLSDIKPDIVFFTNPHNLTRKEYYEDAYLNYLSCYVPYHHEVGSFGGDTSQYGQLFHLAQWAIFSSHESSYELFNKTSPSKCVNVFLTGYPGIEELLEKKAKDNYEDVWKTNDGRVRVIWAPHHIIEENGVSQSSFLKYYQQMKDLAEEYKDEIIWSFKPHPILKSKLYLHPEWGIKRTNDYFDFWRSQPYTQLNLDNYVDLFLSSDSMIHDCGSFLAEYLYMKKPVLYNLTDSHKGQFFNDFGLQALKSCDISTSLEDITIFLKSLKDKEITEKHRVFVDTYLDDFFGYEKPSHRILNIIKENVN